MFGALGLLLKSKPMIAGIAGLGLVTILFFGYRHYTGLLDEVANLKVTQAVLEKGLDMERSAVVQLSEVVSDWELSRLELLQKVKEMQDEAHDARAETRRLHELFTEIDFAALAAADLDSLADDTIDRLWRLIQTATDPDRYGDGGEAGPEAGAAGPAAGGNERRELDSDRDTAGADAGPGPAAVRDAG